MKFLVDAQLPRRLAVWLAEQKFDARHTLDLPHTNRISDVEIIDIAEREGRIVITKDADFVVSHLIRETPSHLLLIAIGNIGNTALLQLLAANLPALIQALSKHRFVELGNNHLIIHD